MTRAPLGGVSRRRDRHRWVAGHAHIATVAAVVVLAGRVADRSSVAFQYSHISRVERPVDDVEFAQAEAFIAIVVEERELGDFA